MLQFYNSTFKSKLLFVFILYIGFLNVDADKIRKASWNISRSLSVFDQIEESGTIGVDKWREQQLVEARNAISINPPFGIGLGNFKEISTHEIHNTFYSLLIENGFLGLFAFLALILAVLFQAFVYNHMLRYRILIFTFILLLMAASYSALIIRERWIWVFIIFVALLKNKKSLQKNEIQS